MRVLGVDPSTKTGLCVVEEPEEGCKMPRPKGELVAAARPNLTGMARARKIADQVVTFALSKKIDVVAVEGYAMGNRNSLVTLVEIGTLIRDRLWKNGFDRVVVVAPLQLKKFVLGKGKGQKDEVRLGVFKRWGFEHPSNDVVDAYALAVVGLAHLGKLEPDNQAQREVLAKLAKETRK